MASDGPDLATALADNFPNGVVALFDRDCRYVIAGGLALDAIGLRRDDMIGKTIREVLPASVADEMSRSIAGAFTGEASSRETSFGGRDYKVYYRPVSGSGGNVDFVLAVSEDITALKETQRELHRATEELALRVEERTKDLQESCDSLLREVADRTRYEQLFRESEHRFKALFESASVGIVVMGIDRRVLSINSAAAAIVGRDRGKLGGVSAESLFDGMDGASDLVMQRIAEVFDTETPLTFEFKQLEHGRVTIREATLFPMRDESGATIALSMMLRDVTESRESDHLLRIQRDLAMALTEVEDMDAALLEVLHAVRRIEDIDGAGLYTVDLDAGRADLALHRGVSETFVEGVRRFDRTDPAFERLTSAQIIYAPTDALPHPEPFRAEGITCIAMLPVLCDGQPVACLATCSRKQFSFPPAVAKALETVVIQAGNALQRVRSRLALKESESRYRGIVDSQYEFVLRTDPQGIVTFVNDAFCRKLGRSAAEIAGSDSLLLAMPASADALRHAAQSLKAPPYRFSYEDWQQCVDGLRWMHWECIAIRDGADLVEIQSVGRDVTDFKEQYLRNTVLDHALQGASDAVIITDAEFRVTYVNGAFTRVFGIPASDAIGMMPDLMAFDGELDINWAEVNTTLAHGSWDGSVRFRLRSGESRTLLMNVSRIHDGGGTILGVIAMASDITEMHRAAERERENALYAAVGRLASMISHEIKTPLTSIRMNVDMLQHDLESDPRFSRSIRILQKEGRRLQDLARAMLDVTKMDQLDEQDCSMKEIFEDLRESMHLECGNRNIRLHVDIPELAIHADREKLRVVFSNLLRNSIEAIGTGGGIRVTLHRDLAGVTVTVHDTGPGVADAEHIFMPLFTTKSDGAGLGLATARRLAELHGGTLDLIRSQPGNTAFSVFLPVHRILAS